MKKILLESSGLHWKWIDLHDPSREELQEVASEFHLHETSVQDCLEPQHLPKIEFVEEGNYLFLVLRGHDHQCSREADTVRELTNKVSVFIGEEFLITVHRRPQPFIDLFASKWSAQVPSALAAGTAAREGFTFRLVTDLLHTVVKTYENPIHESGEDLELYEDQIFKGDGKDSFFRELFLLKRQSGVYSRMLHLYRIWPDLLDKRFPSVKTAQRSPYLQDVKETIERLLFVSDRILETANLLLNYTLSLASHRTNEVVRVLTIFSVFFMPLTFIVGVYGMNFEWFPELKWKWGYPGVMVLMAGVSVAIFLYFKRRKWL